MKKSIVLILFVLILTGGLFAACANQQPSGDPVALTVAAIDLEATRQFTELARTKTAESLNQSGSILNVHNPFNINDANNIAETMVYDSEGIRVLAQSLDYTNENGPALVFRIENQSNNSVVMRASDVVVNGFMTNSTLIAEIAAGASASENLILPGSSLQTNGVETIQYIEFSIRIVDAETWSKSVTTERIRIYTDADLSPTRSAALNGEFAVEREGIHISVKKMENEKLYVYVENNTDTDILVEARDVFINGVQTQHRFQGELLAGTKDFKEISFNLDAGSGQVVGTVDSVELRFYVTTKSDQKLIFETEPILIKFNP